MLKILVSFLVGLMLAAVIGLIAFQKYEHSLLQARIAEIMVERQAVEKVGVEAFYSGQDKALFSMLCLESHWKSSFLSKSVAAEPIVELVEEAKLEVAFDASACISEDTEK